MTDTALVPMSGLHTALSNLDQTQLETLEAYLAASRAVQQTQADAEARRQATGETAFVSLLQNYTPLEIHSALEARVFEATDIVFAALEQTAIQRYQQTTEHWYEFFSMLYNLATQTNTVNGYTCSVEVPVNDDQQKTVSVQVKYFPNTDCLNICIQLDPDTRIIDYVDISCTEHKRLFRAKKIKVTVDKSQLRDDCSFDEMHKHLSHMDIKQIYTALAGLEKELRQSLL